MQKMHADLCNFYSRKISHSKFGSSSLHVQHHEIRILNQLFEALAKSCTGRSIDDTVIRADAEVDHVGLLYAEAILF